MTTEIFETLFKNIIDGTYSPGDRLPSENRISFLYNTPRIHVRKAFKMLEDLGYIFSIQGKGRYVRSKHIKLELPINGRNSFTAKLKKQGLELTTYNVLCKQIQYDKKIFTILNAKETETVFKICLLRIVEKEPIALHSSYIKEEQFPNIKTEGPDITSIYSFFESKGYNNLNSNQTEMSVTFPTSDEQEFFSCPPLVPFIVFETDTLDSNKNILQFSKTLYRSDSFKYIIKHT